MAELPINENSLLWKINTALVAENDDGLRRHLGGSLIGHPCNRYLWYVFRWAAVEEFGGRMLRLFERGHLEEYRFERWLALADVKFLAVDPHTEKQFRVIAVQGHFGGSLDGVGSNVPEAPKTEHLFEFKTHSQNSFKELKKKGVRSSKPQHYAQMQTYMHLRSLTRAVYMAINKNDDELYVERVRYDKDIGQMQVEKAEYVITSDKPPQPITPHRNKMECRWCEFIAVCKGEEPILRTCRSCKFVRPVDGGRWHCTKYEQLIDPVKDAEGNYPHENDKLGCISYEAIEGC